MLTQTHRRKAFTLTESAIVLGITGIVLAAVWLGAGEVWTNYKVYKLQQQIMTVANNVRDTYGKSGKNIRNCNDVVTPAAANKDILGCAIADGLIPAEMATSTTTARHALGGTFALMAANAAGHGRLKIQIHNLQKRDCVKLLMKFPILAPELGVKHISAGTTHCADVDITNIGHPAVDNTDYPCHADAILPFPLSSPLAKSARGWCNQTEQAVTFDFDVRN